MIDIKDFFQNLTDNKISFFCGVPDSLLKSFCAYLADNFSAKQHVITANEGSAVAMAAGHYLATGNPALVYMQNSGFGNTVNPLLSLVDEAVYQIPTLLLIGWRGEPNVKDEPQHKKQGILTLPMLETMQIEYEILPLEKEAVRAAIQKACDYIKTHKKPYALIVRKDSFASYKLQNKKADISELSRELAINSIAETLPENGIIVSTSGMISRELFEYRENNNQGHERDFLTVGSMGHASSIAIGIALSKPNCHVLCLEGDGALLMHMGSLAINAAQNCANFKHIVLNNEAHDSVGGQPTVAGEIDMTAIAKNCGYKAIYSVSNLEKLKEVLKDFWKNTSSAFLEVRVKKGARSDLGRPTTTPAENKEALMEFLKNL
jgi:phosphonopyruvate decarboxylase